MTKLLKKQIESVLVKADTLRRNYGFASLSESIEACRFHLAQNEVVEMGVFGRFKAGKSSLLNAIASADILPVGVLPVTAIVTRLRYAPEARARVVFLNQSECDITLEQVSAFVSENQNPNNQNRVAYVFVETPGLQKYQGVEFLDTPGLGSLYAHNSELARQWIPRSGLALVVVSADEPLSEADADLITGLQRSVPRMAIVLTKADRLTNQELSQVMDYIRAQLRLRFPNDIPIFPFCSITRIGDTRVAVWRQALDEQWLAPLVRNRGNEQERIALHKTRALLKETSALVQVALCSLEKTAEEREQIRKFVTGEDRAFPLIRQEIHLFGNEAVTGLMDRTLGVLMPSFKFIRIHALEDFNRRWPEWRMNLWRITRAFETWMRDLMQREMRALANEKRSAILAPLDQTAVGLERIAVTFRDRLESRVSAALGIKLELSGHKPHVNTPEIPDIYIGRIFDTPWDSLWFLIPVLLIRSILRQHFIRQLEWEIEKHISRLAAQWSDKIAKAIWCATALEEQYVYNLLETVSIALSPTHDRSADLRRILEDMEQLRNSLQEVGSQ